MHIISEIKSNGVTHITENWPSWDAVIDDLAVLTKLNYTAYATVMHRRYVIVIIKRAKVKPALSCV